MATELGSAGHLRGFGGGTLTGTLYEPAAPSSPEMVLRTAKIKPFERLRPR